MQSEPTVSTIPIATTTATTFDPATPTPRRITSGERDLPPQTTMRVTKRNGSAEPVDLDKIVRAVNRCCRGLPDVDAMRVATKTISGLYDGATTSELDRLSIQTAASLITEEPQYGKLAAQLLATYIDKEVRNQEIQSFSQSISAGHRVGLVNARLANVVATNARKLNDSIEPSRDRELEYFGLRTVYDRYLLRHPETRLVIETPQQFFMRIACALTESIGDTLELYRLLSTLEYLPSSPTLFNAGTSHEQLSSCFLLDSPADHLESIYQRYTDVALLSKFSGGIGLAYHRVRSRGSLIESTNGHSNGIVPWLKTLDASVSAVNQGGKRKGAACVYLEPWHADIEAFLELRDNTGDDASRTHNLNLANWIPDLFMKRVDANGAWSLFDPKRVPHLPDLWGADFEAAYEAAEAEGLASKQVKARDLYARMMRTLAQTGNGWMTFKDASNRACNQTALPGRTVHLSNLCTEIIEVTNAEEAAVCNLGSINLGRHVVVVGANGGGTPSEVTGAMTGAMTGAVTGAVTGAMTTGAMTGAMTTRTMTTGTMTSGAMPTGTITGATRAFDFAKLARTVRTAIRQLDRVIDLNYYPIDATRRSNLRWRPVGLGVMGLQDVFFQLGWAFDSAEARALSKQIAEEIYFHALSASVELAGEKGKHPAFDETRAATGELQFDHWSVTPSAAPSVTPSAAPSVSPSVTPSAAPTATPSAAPSATPSAAPTATPSAAPTATPSAAPTATPSAAPSVTPSAAPSATPSAAPSAAPSATPSAAPSAPTRWEELRARIREIGLRNSLMIAIAPTATIASIAGCYECIEPQVSNLFKRETLSGDFIQINRYLVDALKELGLWTEPTRQRLLRAEGSVQGLVELPEELRRRFRTVWEVPMRSLIDMAADRGAFIDQSQSLNLFVESPSIGALSAMYFHAWKKGLKTTYYLRSRPATRIAKTTAEIMVPVKQVSEEAAIACSLENPQSCEACQ